MKNLKRILYMLAGLLILFSGFVLLCAFNPDITKTIAGFLYSDSGQAVTAEGEPKMSESDSDFNFDNSEHSNMDVPVGDFDRNPDEELLAERENEGMAEKITSDYIPLGQFAIIIR